MNLLLQALMNKPTIKRPCCAVCGEQANNQHHIVPRSQGGTKGPTVTLCGSGVSGCHGKAENKQLHFRWVSVEKIRNDNWSLGRGHWEYLETTEPTKYEKALDQEGWKSL